jgi:hypothetical protein
MIAAFRQKPGAFSNLASALQAAYTLLSNEMVSNCDFGVRPFYSFGAPR